jgi:hypothetical protein
MLLAGIVCAAPASTSLAIVFELALCLHLHVPIDKKGGKGKVDMKSHVRRTFFRLSTFKFLFVRDARIVEL